MPLALVTGPTSGIGRAFAQALASEGTDLVLVSRNVDQLRSVGEGLAATYGVSTVVEPADLSVRDDLRRIESLIAGQPLDVLVNNAGFGLAASMLDTDIEDEQRSVDVHISAVLRLTRAALPAMIERGSGEIVNVSSVSGFLARGTYGAHKAWVTRFSRSMNAQYGTDDLRIMALCPGFVHTEFHARSGANASRIPGWMWLEPDNVVREGLEDLRAGRSVSIPSYRYRMLVRASQLAPDRVVARFATFGR